MSHVVLHSQSSQGVPTFFTNTILYPLIEIPLIESQTCPLIIVETPVSSFLQDMQLTIAIREAAKNIVFIILLFSNRIKIDRYIRELKLNYAISEVIFAENANLSVPKVVHSLP